MDFPQSDVPSSGEIAIYDNGSITAMDLEI
jgi:hypothetical protein